MREVERHVRVRFSIEKVWTEMEQVLGLSYLKKFTFQSTKR